MSTESVVINDLKIKVISNSGNGHNDKCFYLAKVTSYAEILKSVQDRVESEYSILRTTYQG